MSRSIGTLDRRVHWGNPLPARRDLLPTVPALQCATVVSPSLPRDQGVAPMYALAIVRYRRPLEDVLANQDVHRAYLRELHTQGVLLASGPFDPRSGGAALLRIPDDDAGPTLDRLRDNDPFTRLGIAQWEVLAWNPVIGREGLDGLSGGGGVAGARDASRDAPPSP